MSMSNPASILFGLAFVALLSAGCASSHTKGPTGGATPASTHSSNSNYEPVVRVQTLARLADGLARTQNQLPGGSAAEHRQLMASVFAQLSEILPVLEGPAAGAEFQQQLQIVRDAQEELANGPQDISPDPTIDTGLRAARDALISIRNRDYDPAPLASFFDKLGSKLDELDTVRGPLHQVVAGEAVGQLSQIITQMSDTLSRRFSSPPQTQPTTQGAVQATGQ